MYIKKYIFSTVKKKLPKEKESLLVHIICVLGFQILLFCMMYTSYSTFIRIEWFVGKVSQMKATATQTDPFCLPQKPVILECDEYKIVNDGQWQYSSEIMWKNLSHKAAHLEMKQLSTSNVKRILKWNSDLYTTETFTTRNPMTNRLEFIRGLPYSLDLKTSKDSYCKHTYILTCDILLKEIELIRKYSFRWNLSE